jgi:membrane protease YdiL (CAAX protease family)
LVSRTIRSISFSTPAPAPFVTYFFYRAAEVDVQQDPGLPFPTILALIAIASSSPPNIWMPTGPLGIKNIQLAAAFDGIADQAFAGDEFGVHQVGACDLQTARNGGSLTSSIGASSSGKWGSCMLSIFTTAMSLGCAYLRSANVQFRKVAGMQSYLKTRSAWSQFFIFLSLVFSGLLIFVMMVGTFAATKATGLSLFEVSDMANWDTADLRYALFLRIMLVVQFAGLFLVPVLVFAYLSDPRPAQYLGLRPTAPLFFVAGILVMVVSLPLVEYLGALNQKIRFPAGMEGWMKSAEKEAQQQIGLLLKQRSVFNLLLNIIMIAGFAGIGEELFFRGVLQRLFIWGFKMFG